MKDSDLIVLGLAGVAVWFMFQSRKTGLTASGTRTGSGTQGSAGVSASTWVDEIFGADGMPFDNGWRYYENGTAIDPQGNYYFGGQKVYSAPQFLT
jgi:hypothetical protein